MVFGRVLEVNAVLGEVTLHQAPEARLALGKRLVHARHIGQPPRERQLPGRLVEAVVGVRGESVIVREQLAVDVGRVQQPGDVLI